MKGSARSTPTRRTWAYGRRGRQVPSPCRTQILSDLTVNGRKQCGTDSSEIDQRISYDRFNPERWLDPASEALPRFAYFPFGGGPRVCIGQQFAMMEMVLILATIAQKFRFRMQPGATVNVLPTFTLRPTPGIPGVIEPR